MLRSLLGAVGLICVFTSAARADVGAQVDCFLPEGPLRCTAVTTSFFESTPGVVQQPTPEVRSSAGATQGASATTPVALSLRVNRVANVLRYRVEVERDESHFAVDRQVPVSAGSDVALGRVVALLQQSVFPFLEVRDPASVENGTLQLQARVAEAQQTAAPGGWYVRPRVWGELFSAGMFAVNAGANLDVNYSNNDYRLQLYGRGSYRYLSIELGDEKVEGGFFGGSAGMVLTRSFGQYSIAALGEARHELNNNLKYRIRAGLGAEWVLSPRLQTNGTNVGVRMRVWSVHDQYAAVTANGRQDFWFPEGHATGFVVVHLSAVDVEASVNARLPLTELEFWNVGANLSVALRPTPAMEIRLGGSLVYQPASLNEPLDSDQLNQVARLTAGTNFGNVNYQAFISVGYAFGNALLQSQDQRWSR